VAEINKRLSRQVALTAHVWALEVTDENERAWTCRFSSPMTPFLWLPAASRHWGARHGHGDRGFRQAEELHGRN
jgi:hypothetical protein